MDPIGNGILVCPWCSRQFREDAPDGHIDRGYHEQSCYLHVLETLRRKLIVQHPASDRRTGAKLWLEGEIARAREVGH